jgi:putative endopeptidase
MNFRTFISVSVIAAMVSSCGSTPNENQDQSMDNPKVIDLANMDKEVNPGDDFFKYANGGWLKANPIPEEYSRYGAFEVLDKKSKEQIKDIINEVSTQTDAEKGSPAQQIRDFYKAGMDTAKIETLGYQPIEGLLTKIDEIKNKSEIIDLMVSMDQIGMSTAFYLFASIDDKDATRYIPNFHQGGLGLPDRDYYLGTDERSVEMQQQYREHIQQMFQLVSKDVETATAMANAVMNIETQLAKASMSRLAQRDPNATYNLTSVEDIEASAKHFSLAQYMTKMGIANATEANIRQPEFFKAFDQMINNVSIEEWKAFFQWKVINANASLLSSPFVDQNFAFYGTVLSGKTKMQPRWKRIINATNSSLGEAVGKIYVEKHFPAEAKEKMVTLVSNLREALKESIQNLDWMTAVTKEKALDKLSTMNLKVGYPNKWKDYSSIDITADNYVQNIWNADAFATREDLAKIGKPIDLEEWGMNPQTVNAYYSPNRNEIVFPAAILQAPFFSLEADDAVNYGSIGVVIGHEMTHGFDDQGRKYDRDGNLNDWWTEVDAQNFEAKTQILVDQFNNYSILDSLHVDGKLTLGENIADNGGLYVAFRAMMMAIEKNGAPEDIDGLTYQQRFFISYAQVWRQHIRDKELMRRLKEDVHSPGESRVNGGIVNLPQWYEAFSIKEGDALYVAPENRAKVW